jgi:hypothetical protein
MSEEETPDIRRMERAPVMGVGIGPDINSTY